MRLEQLKTAVIKNLLIIFANPLYKNGILIYATLLSSALFGFFFWMMAARLYSAEDVGIVSALISFVGIIANLSCFGFPNGIMRFLPSSEDKNELFNSTWLISLCAASFLSFVFIIEIDLFAPALMYFRDINGSLIFLTYILFQISNTYINNALLSFRKAEYSFALNLILGMRLLFLTQLAFYGIMGILGSTVFSYIISFFAGVFLLSRLDIHLRPSINKGSLHKILDFSIANYINDFLSLSQTSILPIIIINKVGAKEAGYFFVAFSIAAMLFAIPNSIFTSMLIEGSNGKSINEIIFKSVKFTSLLLVPCIAVIWFEGDTVLSLFGMQYSENAYDILKILAISSPFVAINSMFLSLKRISRDIKMLLIVNIALFILIMSLCWLLIDYLGILGVGLGWLLGQCLMSIIAIIIILRSHYSFHSNFSTCV